MLDRAFDDRGRAGRVALAAVGEEQGFEVGGRGAHQARAVGDHMRHDVLVGQDDPFGRLGQAQGTDDAALEVIAVALLVDVQRGGLVGGQDALGEPAAQGVGREGVAGVRGDGLREDQADDVVRVSGLQVVQTVGAYDHVIRR